MREALCGVATDHREGFVFRNDRAPHHVLLCFRTPFFCELRGKRLEGRAGWCVLQRAGTRVVHGPLCEKERFVNDWIYFDAEEGELDGLELPFEEMIPMEDNGTIGELIARILREKARADAYSPRLISDCIYRMLVTLKRAQREGKGEETLVGARFRRARVQILQRYGEHWTLERMAELAGYSVSRFCALYSELFGVSPMNDLLATRLEMAKQLLSLGVYKVGDVATMCGFSSIHYFSNYFKRNTGISPISYENQA